MYSQIIKNDLLKNKSINLIIMLFVASAAMLVSLASILAVNLSGAVDALMIASKTTHFMQMHSVQEWQAWQTERAHLERFAAQQENVEALQVLEFLNIDGADIVFPSSSLGGNMQDNGLSVQSKAFDFLLDLEGNRIDVRDGELYVPVCYMRDGTAKQGDNAVVCGKTFTVAGFLRDSQMNSSLSSSKRFLVSENDFLALKSNGNMEYLIEFRLKDLSALGVFEAAYASAGLPANGPMVTYGLFKTLNSFSDGMMIGIILLVSLLVVAVAFLCIRFTLLAKIEDETREIGVMKAIGLRHTSIRKIYLAKYTAIVFSGSLLGYALSLMLEGRLTENIRLFMGESLNASLAPLLGVVGVLLVFLVTLAYIIGVLGRLRKISAAQAIRFGTGHEKAAGGKHFLLSQNRFLPTNVFLGLKDVLTRKRLYATMLSVIIIASFIMIVPQNLYHTIASKSFSAYMGIGNCDLRIDIQQTGLITEKTNEALAILSADPAIAKSVVLTTKLFHTSTQENLKIELGNHDVFPVAYSTGRAPAEPDEIALSAMAADGLSKQVGDSVTLLTNEGEKSLMVSGIYSDITNGGKTAKAVFTDDSLNPMWSILCAELVAPTLVDAKVQEYANRFSYAKVSSIQDYMTQIFGQTLHTVKSASYTAVAISLIITLLVTLLFMKLLLAKDRYSIAVMKTVGFTNRDIRMQYVIRSLFVLAVGILLGTVLANTLGEALGGMVISSFGASFFTFNINPLTAYLLCPFMMVCAVLIGAICGTRRAGQIKICNMIKE